LRRMRTRPPSSDLETLNVCADFVQNMREQ
jgi:hypothetical protein